LKQGVVVRGIAGRRSEYRPVVSRLTVDSSPDAIAAAFAGQFGFKGAYVADLDAIAGDSPNLSAYAAIVRVLPSLWIDAGVGSAAAALALDDACRELDVVGMIIVGLESLASPEALREIVDALGHERVAFSLDLKQGRPLTTIARWRGLDPLAIAQGAVDAGIRRVIVLDLADVGTGGGTRTLELVTSLRRAHPMLSVIAGGGVRGVDDLRTLHSAGCSTALVASALHDGRFSRDDLHEFGHSDRGLLD
jgi:phosphoribosylformimino-5-aminoimidazole carboxamide ribotide isomerase